MLEALEAGTAGVVLRTDDPIQVQPLSREALHDMKACVSQLIVTAKNPVYGSWHVMHYMT